MNYIINPNWFYIINVVDCFATIVHIACGMFGILAIVFFIVMYNSNGTRQDLLYAVRRAARDPKDEDYQVELKQAQDNYDRLNKWLNISVVITLVCLIVSIFIPSKDTLIEMQVAKLATYENAEWTLDTIKSAVDYIVNAIHSLKS